MYQSATKVIPHAYILLKVTDLGYLNWDQKEKANAKKRYHEAEKWR
jgi:hypothetical protein